MTSAVKQPLFKHTNPPWVVAEEVWLRGEKYLSVYRSVLVTDSDIMYEPVAGALRDAELISRDLTYDDDMMFGRAEWLLYRL